MTHKMKRSFRLSNEQLTKDEHAEAKIANILTVQWGKAYLKRFAKDKENVRNKGDDTPLL